MKNATRRFLFLRFLLALKDCYIEDLNSAEGNEYARYEPLFTRIITLHTLIHETQSVILEYLNNLLARAERRKQQWGLEWFDEGYWTGRADAPFGEPETGWEGYFLGGTP